MNVHTSDVNIYRLAVDDPPKLLGLLAEARNWRQPVALLAINDRLHTRLTKVGVPTAVTAEGVTLRMQDGARFRCELWEVDKCAPVPEWIEVAA